MQNLYVVSGIATDVVVAEGKLRMSLAHTGPQPSDPSRGARVTVFEVEANNGVAEWAATLPLVNGTPVTAFCYRAEEQQLVVPDEEGGQKAIMWLKLYANNIIIRDPDSKEVVSGMLVGRAGRDAEMKFLPTGTPFTNFPVAVDYGVFNPTTQKWDNTTTWCRVTVWGSRPDAATQSNAPLNAADKVLKGALVQVVIDDLHASTWPAQDGTLRLSVDVSARQFSVLKPPASAETKPAAPPPMAHLAAVRAAAAASASEAKPAAANAGKSPVVDDSEAPF